MMMVRERNRRSVEREMDVSEGDEWETDEEDDDSQISSNSSSDNNSTSTLHRGSDKEILITPPSATTEHRTEEANVSSRKASDEFEPCQDNKSRECDGIDQTFSMERERKRSTALEYEQQVISKLGRLGF